MNNGFGLVIVGDEILSGRRTDVHLGNAIEMAEKRGFSVDWCRIVSDDMELLVNTYKESLADGRFVLSTGGIGGTPDDLTRHAIAKALGVNLERQPEGLRLLQQFAKERNRELKPEHYRMIEFPEGADIIPNPVNNIPGFSIANHHFVPGFPEMAKPMMEWVLDNIYGNLANRNYTEQALLLRNTHESLIIGLMEDLLSRYEKIKVFSLPIMKFEDPRVELGVKGEPDAVASAMLEIQRFCSINSINYEELGTT